LTSRRSPPAAGGAGNFLSGELFEISAVLDIERTCGGVIMNKRERAARQGGPQKEYQRHPYTKASAEIQDKSRELAGRRSEWMRKVLKSKLLKAPQKNTLISLSLYFRGKSKTAAPSFRAWPSHEELARGENVSARTIRRHLARAKKVGFIFIEGREGGAWTNDSERRGQTNYYYLGLPDGISLDDDGGHDDDEDCHEAKGVDAGDDDQKFPTLDKIDQAPPTLVTDVQGCDTNTGQNEHQPWTKIRRTLDNCCPIKTPIENPTKESFSLILDSSSVASLYGFIGQNAQEGENDHPFPPVPDKEQAYAFILRLLGEGDEARGKRMTSATLAGCKLKYDAMEGKLRTSLIKGAIKSYLDAMVKLEPLALRSLQTALDEKGTLAEASDHIPRNARVVPIEQWRMCFCRMDDRDEWFKQKRFQDALGYLVDQGTVLAWGDRAWLASEAPQSATERVAPIARPATASATSYC
jgi:hypothetical protein